MRKLKIGITGMGQFAQCFVPLFQNHPWVESVSLSDLDSERLRRAAEKFGVAQTYASHSELCCSDVDAVAIFTQRHLHAPQAAEALDHGKHVYCAVPAAHSLEDLETLVRKVESTGLIYMTGETSFYYPSAIYCRRQFRDGKFGHFVYGEAQYLHDMSHGFYDAFRYSGGPNWKQVAGFPPMYYPTHSTSMVLSVTGERVTSVSCLGFRDRADDGIFTPGGNLWDNEFSNETALMRTSGGGMVRINEFRRVGWKGKSAPSVYMSLYGTQGCFEENAGSKVWTGLSMDDYCDVTQPLACRPVQVRDTTLHEALQQDFFEGYSSIHPTQRLPEPFQALDNGHSGSHQFLVDDFIRAVCQDQLPPCHVWAAARWCAPGLTAHASALAEGKQLSVPDFGAPAASLPILDWETGK